MHFIAVFYSNNILSERKKKRFCKPEIGSWGVAIQWILDTWGIWTHNTMFLAIKCQVLYLNETMMFCLKFLAYSQYLLQKSFDHLVFFFIKCPL